MKSVKIYVDGSSLGNPGLSGWGAVYVYGKKARAKSGPLGFCTNGRAEVEAAVHALEGLTEPCSIDMFSDSQYLVQSIENWMGNWMRNGWRRADGKPVKNRDCLEMLSNLAKQHELRVHWLKGHDGHRFQQQADSLAWTAAKFQKISDHRFVI